MMVLCRNIISSIKTGLKKVEDWKAEGLKAERLNHPAGQAWTKAESKEVTIVTKSLFTGLQTGFKVLPLNFSTLWGGTCRSLVLLLAFIGWGLFANAQQIAPVLANTQINPPYSAYLSDYAAPGSTKFQVNLFLKDLTKTNYPCRLRIKIEGFGITIQSKNDFNVPALFINGGQLSVFSGADLAPYFNPQNLVFNGLNQTEFIRNGGKLPEGVYRFTVEVIDYYRKNLVSNSAVSVASIFLAYPPIINQPFNLSKVTPLEPQNIVFQWTPRSTGSINSAYNIAYKFKLVELIPANRDPNDAIRTSRPIYETYTDQTVLVYGIAEPALNLGSNYAVQVQAVDAEGKDLFVNNGNSEVVKFTYGDKCASPINTMAELSGLNSIKVSWNVLPLQQAFTIRYREANKPGAQWFEQEIYTPNYLIQGLRSATSYEFQVKAQCIYGYGDYSELQTFNVPNETLTQGDFVCGKIEDLPAVAQGDALPILAPPMVFFAGKFPIVVTSATGSNGVFSGTGTVGVPFLNALSFQVEFKDIRVNTALKMTDGKVVFTRENLQQAIANTIAGITVKPDADGNVTAISSNGLPIIIDAAISPWPQTPTYDAATKTVKFTASVDGEPSKAINLKLVDGQPPLTFQDKSEQTFQVDSTGKVTNLGKIPPSQFLGSGAGTNLALDQSKGRVVFSGAANQKYGFDTYNENYAKQSGKYAADYKPLNNGLASNKVSWKSIAATQSDEVVATFSKIDQTLDNKKLIFKTGTGETLGAKALTDSTYSIGIIGALANNTKEIYAVYPKGSGIAKDIYLGKINIASYSEIVKKVVVVPVNGAGKSLPTAANLAVALNKIYQQAVVKWEVKLVDNFTTDTQFDNLDNGESSAMSAYTKEQKALVKAYKQSHTLANDTYYIFVVNALSNGDTGYMVRGGQVGFVGLTPALSEGEGAISRTIAHELGHGAFMLQHTWDEPGLTKATTNNLMDYAGGTELWYGQWRYMRNTDLIFRPFEGDDEGAYLGSNYFVAINGYPIQIKDADIGSLTVGLRTRYASGTLYGFKNKKNEKYLPYYKDNNFVGYQNQTILTDIIPITKITEKTLKVQFIEATNSLCEYKVSTGMYKVPMIIYIKELLSIDMPLKRDSSTIFKRTDCDEDGNIIINDDYTLFDYSAENGTKGLSKEDKEFLDVIAKNAKSFTGENVHIYILHKDDPKYAEKKAKADEDKEPKLVFTINKDGKLNLEYKINVPKWLVNLLPDAGKTDACMLDYVNKELDKLHTRTEYIISPWPKKMAMETAVVFYNSFTSSIYCATSEELVRNENAYVKFGAGAIHELIATVDVDQLIQGITELVTKSVSGKIDGYAKYFTGIKQTFEDAKANKIVPYDVIFSRLVPPGISDTGNQIKMVYDLGVQAKNLLFTSCQNKTELGTNMCPYRWGRATVMILPIIFTGGEWAILKIKSIGLAAEFGSEALRGMEMIAAAQKGGRTVIDDVGKTIVKDADGSVSTIKNVSEGKVVITEGVESIEDAVKVLEKEIADPDLLKAAKEQVIEEVTEDVNKLKDKDWLKNIVKGQNFEKYMNPRIRTDLTNIGIDLRGTTQIDQLYVMGPKGNMVIMDNGFVKEVYAIDGSLDYVKVIYNDSKLNIGTQWSKNQKTEIINYFRDNPNKEFILMEVRSSVEKLKNSPITQSSKIRLYRQDVYKSISDGNGNFGKSIRMKDIKFKE